MPRPLPASNERPDGSVPLLPATNQQDDGSYWHVDFD